MPWRPRFGLITLLSTPVYVGLAITWWTTPYTMTPRAGGCNVGSPDSAKFTVYRSLAGKEILHGPSIQKWMAGDKVWREISTTWRQGVEHGPYVAVHQSCRTVGQHDQGQKSGEWNEYDEHGRHLSASLYEAGKLMKTTAWFEDGTIKSTIVRSAPDRLLIERWQKPNFREVVGARVFSDEKRDGRWYEDGAWTWYDADGRPRETIRFDRGIPAMELNEDERKLLLNNCDALPGNYYVVDAEDDWFALIASFNTAYVSIRYNGETLAEDFPLWVLDEADEHQRPGLRAVTAFVLKLRRNGLQFRIISKNLVEFAFVD